MHALLFLLLMQHCHSENWFDGNLSQPLRPNEYTARNGKLGLHVQNIFRSAAGQLERRCLVAAGGLWMARPSEAGLGLLQVCGLTWAQPSLLSWLQPQMHA